MDDQESATAGLVDSARGGDRRGCDLRCGVVDRVIRR